MDEPTWLRKRMTSEDPNAVIGECAVDGTSALCRETMQTFALAYGAETGNIALRALTLGGMYLGGGIAPKSLKMLADGGFMQAYLDKGRLSPLLETIPVRVILDESRRSAGRGGIRGGARGGDYRAFGAGGVGDEIDPTHALKRA